MRLEFWISQKNRDWKSLVVMFLKCNALDASYTVRFRSKKRSVGAFWTNCRLQDKRHSRLKMEFFIRQFMLHTYPNRGFIYFLIYVV